MSAGRETEAPSQPPKWPSGSMAISSWRCGTAAGAAVLLPRKDVPFSAAKVRPSAARSQNRRRVMGADISFLLFSLLWSWERGRVPPRREPRKATLVEVMIE